MPPPLKPYTTLIDFITGRETPDIGAEENRQVVERFLVEQKNYAKEDIEVDVEITLFIHGEIYRSLLDLVVTVDSRRVIAIKCAAGSLGSREREILAAARVLGPYQIPLAVASDGKAAVVLDTVSGKRIGDSLEAIPSKAEFEVKIKSLEFKPMAEDRREREQLIFRTYDIDNVNSARRL